LAFLGAFSENHLSFFTSIHNTICAKNGAKNGNSLLKSGHVCVVESVGDGWVVESPSLGSLVESPARVAARSGLVRHNEVKEKTNLLASYVETKTLV
jgi:hypothetical protein